MLDLRVAGRYRLKKQIGKGSFGEVFLGTDIQSNKEVAIKLEKVDSPQPQLNKEWKILINLQGGPGIPRIHWKGIENAYNVLVMELLGFNLEELFNICSRKFSLKTVLLLAEQMLCRIEHVHSKNYLHRDIKPENFMLGLGKLNHILYIVDFGLSKSYKDPVTNRHVIYRERRNLTGTARYASLNSHKGIDHSRRDDLESIGYMLIYFLKGNLPWQGVSAETKQRKLLKIMQTKSNTSLEDLCEGCPSELLDYMKYCRALNFQARPNYTYLRRGFKALFERENLVYDYVFDWTLLKYKKKTPKKLQKPKKATESVSKKSNPSEKPVVWTKKSKKCVIF